MEQEQIINQTTIPLPDISSYMPLGGIKSIIIWADIWFSLRTQSHTIFQNCHVPGLCQIVLDVQSGCQVYKMSFRTLFFCITSFRHVLLSPNILPPQPSQSHHHLSPFLHQLLSPHHHLPFPTKTCLPLSTHSLLEMYQPSQLLYYCQRQANITSYVANVVQMLLASAGLSTVDKHCTPMPRN